MPIQASFAMTFATALVLSSLAGTANAQIDFNHLLAQLPEQNEDAGSDLLPAIEATDDLLLGSEEIATPPGESSSPSDLVMPLDNAIRTPRGTTLGGPPATNATPLEVLPSLEQGGPQAEVQHWPSEPTPPVLGTPSDRSAPSSILQNPMVAPAPQPQASVNFQDMFQQQDSQPTDVAMAAPAEFHVAAGYGGCNSSSCQPHRRPSLPPPATLESMYHARPCYRDVWAGYEAEKQRECDKYHKHLHGKCDCLQPSCPNCGPVLYPNAPCTQSASPLHRMLGKRCDCGHCKGGSVPPPACGCGSGEPAAACTTCGH